MTNTIDVCEKCGAEVEFRQENSIQGLFCKNCGWIVFTTYIPEIYSDSNKYVVYITNPNFNDRNQISIISKISWLSYLEVRKLLQEDKPLIFSGRAPEVLKIKEKLDMEGISFEIYPKFNY